MRKPRLGTLILALIHLACQISAAQVPSKPGDWPQWRGPKRDGVSHETGLLKEWPKEGPRVAWQVDSVGVGYSSLAVKDGRVFTQGDLDGVEHVIALNAADGKTLWAVQPGPVISLLAERIANEFKQLDRNNDGEVDEIEALHRFGWELNKYDRPVGGDGDSGTRARATALFTKLDKDGDGKLSFVEAANLLRDVFERVDAEDKQADSAKLAASRAAELIAQCDKDGDGQVSRKESQNTALGRHFGRIDQKDPTTDKPDEQLTVAEIEAAFVKFEPGRDGVITKSELVDYFVNSKLPGDGKLTLDELRVAFGGYRNGMGDGPRGTPTVDGDRVYAEGGNGDVTCLEAETGKTVWHVNLPRDFGGGVPGWGYSESPLVVDDLLIVTPGGKKGTLVALNKLTGDSVWSSGEVTEGAHYSSAVLATIGGERQIVQFARESVFGVSIQEGKFLWKYTNPANGTANCCVPIIDDDLVFASSSYGKGGGLARITALDGKFSAEEVYFESKMACHHGGIVKIGDWLYSNAAGPLICMDFRTGQILWQNRSVGKGALMAADGMLYAFSENHEVALVDASPGDYSERGRFKVASHGHPSWAHPVVAGGKLYIRDQQSLSAYDVRREIGPLNMEPVKIGVIGLGRFGRLHALTVAGLAEAELAGLVARRQASLDQLAADLPGVPGWTSLERALDESQAEAWVVACTTAEHVAVTTMLLEAGKKVLLEKPVADNLIEARRLTSLVRPDSSNLMLGHILLFNSEFQQLREEVSQRGPIAYIDNVRHRPATIVQDFPGENPLFTTMVHDLYAVQVLVERAEPVYYCAQYHRTPDGAIDVALAQLKWSHGPLASFVVSYITPAGMYPRGFDRTEVFGEGWSARICPNPRPMEVWGTQAEWPLGLEIRAGASGATGMLAEELRCFCRVVRGVHAVPVGATYADALQVQEWMERLDAAANSSG